ncbi:hypothetical protein ZEAMMB73_Zm00001d043982 [Zea mays]|uniref:Uncharacterized protein n=1 Tax=Zea mays TaxID=4577 RepID=A0A1D6NGS3_MAIZE|nr:hypothetical protein ZEAMMB73_Zm00001d043982 [Zea mays]
MRGSRVDSASSPRGPRPPPRDTRSQCSGVRARRREVRLAPLDPPRQPLAMSSLSRQSPGRTPSRLLHRPPTASRLSSSSRLPTHPRCALGPGSGPTNNESLSRAQRHSRRSQWQPPSQTIEPHRCCRPWNGADCRRVEPLVEWNWQPPPPPPPPAVATSKCTTPMTLRGMSTV